MMKIYRKRKVEIMKNLTKSEREIALLVMEGLTNKEIASKRFTVLLQLSRIHSVLNR